MRIKPNPAIYLALIFLFGSCSHTRHIENDSKDYKSEIERKSKKAPATIDLRNGKNYKARFISFSGDSLKFADSINSIKRTASIGDIKSIRFRDRINGALEGGGIGIAAGVAIGVVIGLVSGDDPPGFMSLTALARRLWYGWFGGMFGALIGLPSGYTSGSYTIYEFPDEKTDSITEL